MSALQPRYSKEEFARRGDEIYRRDIEPQLRSHDIGKFVAIDIETSNYEIDPDEFQACDRLLARVPGAQTWLKRVGSLYTRRFGPRRPRSNQ